MSETSHTSVYYFMYLVSPIRTSVSHQHPLELGWIQPVTSQHIPFYSARTILFHLHILYTVHCTLYILHILYTVYIVYVPCFPVSDVEVSPSTSVRALVHPLYKS